MRADARSFRPDLQPATGTDAAQTAKLRARPRGFTRPNMMKVGGNVTVCKASLPS